MTRGILIFVFTVIVAVSSYAQKVQKVTATYTYYAPENVTLEEAKRTALDRAKIQAIADAFGTLVSQSNSTVMSNQNGVSDSHFFSLGGSEVKGEWIETTKEPVYDIRYESNMLVVSVEVSGCIREIVNASIDISARILRNGIEDRFESEEFRDGDDLYLSFISPVNGYLAVYLMDGKQNVYCLLPYRMQNDGIYKVSANHRYLFFNIKESEPQERQYVDEYTMTCEHSTEQNQIYIVFSPHPFAKAIDNSIAETLPRELDFDDFQKWLARCKTKDKQMVNISKSIIIKK